MAANSAQARSKTVSGINDDSEEWAERCGYWATLPTKGEFKARRKRKNNPLLVLSGHGVRLYVKNATLIVQNGLTHFPQEREEWQFFSGKWRVPSRIIVLDGKGGLTFHALCWLAERDIPLVHIDWQGNVVQVVGGNGYAIDRKLAEAQLAATKNGAGLKISRWLISEKISNSMTTLRRLTPRSFPIDRVLQKLKNSADELQSRPPSTVSALLGIEGRAAYAYFSAWRSMPLRWKDTSRRPIPDDWKRIGQRSSRLGNWQHPNRGATHPVNTILNYAYGVLESRVRAHVVGAGLDPTIGFFHGKSPRDKAALVYDLMEPLRPLVDRQVLEFVRGTVFSPADFTVTPKGVCRLNPELARAVVRKTDVDLSARERIDDFLSHLKRR